MTPWNIWTDGSCMTGLAEQPPGRRGFGGWCAIVEHDHDGFVLRGRTPETTNVRMELRAATEGLRAVPAGEPAILHTDCTTILCVRDYHLAGRIPTGPDAVAWLELDAEMSRVGPLAIRLVVRGQHDPLHIRAHAFAGAEARGALRGLPANSTPLEDARTLLRDSARIRRAYLPPGRPAVVDSGP